MKWALAELNKFRGSQLIFDERINLTEELQRRDQTIIEVLPVEVKGTIDVDRTSYLAHFSVNTSVVLPSSRSLEPVTLPLSFMVDEVYMRPSDIEALTDVSEEQKSLIMPLEKDMINLNEAVQDFILLNLPIQILTEAEKNNDADLPAGDFWQVLSEEDVMKKKNSPDSEQKIDPRLAKLSELLKDDSE
ncbi:YceD family protein [Vagococcus sp.]|uniref:YceD family protein n=1 Tax=Vagococcus sp. TaxID=1933889 RepID=UPI003F9D036A